MLINSTSHILHAVRYAEAEYDVIFKKFCLVSRHDIILPPHFEVLVSLAVFETNIRYEFMKMCDRTEINIYVYA